MSKLFSTLLDVLTPYANKINLHNESIEDIQGDVEELSEHIEIINDELNSNTGRQEITGWIADSNVLLSTSIKNVNINTAIVEQSTYSCVILPCKEGDVFYVTSKGASGARNWAFLSSDGTNGNNNVISRAVAGSNNYYYENHKIIAPKNTQYVVFNASLNYERLVMKGDYLIDQLDEMRTISILFVGNSLTQDGIAYLPYLLTHYYPYVKFKFYIWYQGGYTLTEHYQKWINNQTCTTFSIAENTDSWTNYDNSVTMKSILENYKFDIVSMQGYYNYTPSTEISKPTDDITAWNNCQDYIQANYKGGNPLEFVTLFHAPLRSDAATVFARTKEWNAAFLRNTIAQDMIPNGIAVYRALSTTLDELGDDGHLSPDGTHAQEGLPCLLQTYSNTCWIFDKMSINKSIYGCSLRITDAIYQAINVPGPNLGTGVITGTDSENLLAQEIAIKAYKEGKQFVMNNIYSEN